MKFLKQPWYIWCGTIAIIAIAVIVSHNPIAQFLVHNPPIQSELNTPASVVPSINSPSLALPAISQESKYGHFPYAEADSSRLMVIASYAQQEYQRLEQLDREAALALMKMIYAARDEGVWIIAVSGFRNIANQELLFKSQIEKRGSPEEAAKLSAPPGHSEHHTGYAIDLAEGLYPKKDITYEFENTSAYKWLTIHAKEFGFEMSFPANNAQRVSYEPWHWRFMGSPAAAEVFARSRSLR
ncbi:M15 family metallopeptidase [Microcoleus sp. N9_B2]|uniref:M15 family metallopeptidase n=1 Tax=unclassified Microcoleus TaxID=2642155 RepID=UPI002FD54963